ncbi:hypothetical protein X274_01985 [Marinitoga sp. 1155]|nr:hypothetical protein X274_01985 [Marinitoga sp. 1155]
MKIIELMNNMKNYIFSNKKLTYEKYSGII